MGKHFALTLQLPFYRIEQDRQKQSQSKAALGLPGLSKTFYIGLFLFVSLVSLSILYLIQVNSFSTEGYKINTLQNQIASLQTENVNLEIQTSQFESPQIIQTDPSTYAMVPVTSVNYLKEPTATILSER